MSRIQMMRGEKLNVLDKIHFDGSSLFVGQTSKIIYKGPLCIENPSEIYMHYGYGYNWENLQELKLFKGPTGYEADITFIKADELNFCFRSQTGKWDNNNKTNYQVQIEPAPVLCTPGSEYLHLEIPTLKTFYYVINKIKLALSRTFSTIKSFFKKKTISE